MHFQLQLWSTFFGDKANLPKGSDLSTANRRDLTRIEQRLKGRPRRVLGRKTPDEAYELALLKYQKQQLDRETALC